MSNFIVTNRTEAPAVLVVRLDQVASGRFPVAPGGQIVAPLPEHYDVRATIVLRGNIYYSVSLTIDARGKVIASVRARPDGEFDFEIEALPATKPGMIVFENRCRESVTFELRAPNYRFSSACVVGPAASAAIRVGEVSLFAIVDGTATAVLSTTRPIRPIAIVAGKDGAESYALVFSDKTTAAESVVGTSEEAASENGAAEPSAAL
jgi:hypothetical protein